MNNGLFNKDSNYLSLLSEIPIPVSSIVIINSSIYCTLKIIFPLFVNLMLLLNKFNKIYLSRFLSVEKYLGTLIVSRIN